jgi:hypothetical protein
MVLGIIGAGSIALYVIPILLFFLIRYYYKSWKKNKA